MCLLKSREIRDPIDNSVIGKLELVELSPDGDYSLEILLNKKLIKKYKMRTRSFSFYETFKPKIDHQKWRFDQRMQRWEKK